MTGLFPTPRATDGGKNIRTTEGARAEVARNKGPDLGAAVKAGPKPTQPTPVQSTLFAADIHASHSVTPGSESGVVDGI